MPWAAVGASHNAGTERRVGDIVPRVRLPPEWRPVSLGPSGYPRPKTQPG